MRDCLAFGVVAVLGAVIAIATAPMDRPVEDVAAGLLLVLVALLAVGSVRSPAVAWIEPVSPWLFFVAFALLRDISGGTTSRAAVLVALPMVWLALFGRRWQLTVASVLAFAVFLIPSIVIGPPRYSSSDWQRGLAWFLFGILVAPIVLRVVATLDTRSARLEETVARLDAVMRGATMAAVISTDLDGRIVDFNPGAERLLGYSGHEVRSRGLMLTDLYATDELDAVATELGMADGLAALAALGRTAAESRIWRFVRADADQVFARSVITELTSPDGAGTGLLVMAIDADTAIRTRQELVAERDQSDRLFDDSPQPIALVDTASGSLLRVNDAFAVLFEQPKSALISRPLAELSEGDDGAVADHLASLGASSSGRSQSEWTISWRGTVRHLVLSSTVLDAPGEDARQRALVTVTDLSERYQFEQQLAHLADHDPLTGLANRRLFNRELSRHVEFSRRYGPRGALLVLDLDNFKEVNDTLGHSAGDQLIISVASLLERTVRTTDTVARLGGDEFAILLLETNREGAERVAGAVIEAVAGHISTLDGQPRNVTASVGVVVVDNNDKSAADLLADADMTMYDAKDAGRNQYAVLDYQSHQQPRMAARIAWGDRIRRAIDHDKFELHLQPVKNVSLGKVTGAEALLRLADSDTLIFPNQFLYIAERSDLILSLDQWVIRHSLRILADIQRTWPDFQLEINISGRSLGHPDLEATLVDELRVSGADPTGLVIEVTETAAVANVDLARAFAERVTALGCRFALDDFGAGFGSFYYLKHLLFDYIKIDGEFIANIHKNPADRIIVRSIVDMARGLGKRTIAEFVSEPAIYDVVAAEGVDFAQGYYLGKPMPLSSFMTSVHDAAESRPSAS